MKNLKSFVSIKEFLKGLNGISGSPKASCKL